MNEQKVAEWMDAQAMLSIWKSKELILRKKLLDLFPTNMGSEKIIVDGRELTITRGVRRTIEVDELSIIMSSLTDEEKECVQYKPSLIAKAYTKLPENSLLSRAVTVKPSLPTIKWKEVDAD